MSNINKIIELNKLINNSSSLQNDIAEISNLIKTMFQKKYISKLSEELKIQKQNHQKNPTKEIQLIQAVKPFINQEKHSDIDKITDTLINITTLMDIQKDFLENAKNEEIKQKNKKQIFENKTSEKEIHRKKTAKEEFLKEKSPKKQISAMNTLITQSEDASIKEDGIYDIDEACLLSNQSVTQKSNQNFLAMYILLIAMILKNN